MGERLASQLVWVCAGSVLAGPVLAGSRCEAAAGHKCMPKCTCAVDEELHLNNSTSGLEEDGMWISTRQSRKQGVQADQLRPAEAALGVCVG